MSHVTDEVSHVREGSNNKLHFPLVLTNEFPIGLLQGGWPKAYLKGIFVILPFRSNLTQLGYHRVLEEKQAEEEERIKEAASWPQLRGNSSKVLRSSE